MVPAALDQGLGKGFPTSLALSKLAHGLHNGFGVTAVKVQIRWSELEGASASGRCSIFQLEPCTRRWLLYMVPAVSTLELC